MNLESRREFQVFGDGELHFTGRVHPNAGFDIEGQQAARAKNALMFFEPIAGSFEIDPGKDTGKAVHVEIVSGCDLLLHVVHSLPPAFFRAPFRACRGQHVPSRARRA